MRGNVDRGGSRSSEDVATWQLGHGSFSWRVERAFELGLWIARIASRHPLRMESSQGLSTKPLGEHLNPRHDFDTRATQNDDRRR